MIFIRLGGNRAAAVPAFLKRGRNLRGNRNIDYIHPPVYIFLKLAGVIRRCGSAGSGKCSCFTDNAIKLFRLDVNIIPVAPGIEIINIERYDSDIVFLDQLFR